MKRTRFQPDGVRRRRGFTVLETMMSLTIFSVVGYGLFVAVDIGYDSSDLVTEVTGQNRKLRAAARSLTDELGQSSDANITITEGWGGNHDVSFRVPIWVGGAEDWGVYDRTLGTTEDDWNKADWQVRYKVEPVVVDGQQRVDLFRQVIDADGQVQKSKVVVENLVQPGGENAVRAFTVEQTGDVWTVNCTAYGSEASDQAATTSFHIRTRN